MTAFVDPNNLIGAADIAREYKMKQEYCRQLMAEGKIRAWFVANTWITTRELVEDYLRSRKPGGPQRPLKKHGRSTK
jgi:hypothetical protein